MTSKTPKKTVSNVRENATKKTKKYNIDNNTNSSRAQKLFQENTVIRVNRIPCTSTKAWVIALHYL